MKKKSLILFFTMILSLFMLIALSSCKNFGRVGGRIVDEVPEDNWDVPPEPSPLPVLSMGPEEEIGDWIVKKFTCVGNEDRSYYSIVHYIGSDTTASIPEKFNGVPVTDIDKTAFTFSYATSVVMPASIISASFVECDRLISIYFSGDIASWCNINFGHENPLVYAHDLYINNVLATEITIPDGVKEIHPSAFTGWSGTKIVIPGSVKKIGENAFSGCEKLTNVTLAEGLREMGECCFSGCRGLTGITVPQSVYSIEKGAFTGCRNLKTVLIPDHIKVINEDTFNGCAYLAEIVLPSSLEQIGASAFNKCSSLEEVIIPNNVTTIGSGAFGYCTELEDVTIGNKVELIDKGAFFGCENLEKFSFVDTQGWYLSDGHKHIKDKRGWARTDLDVTDPFENADNMRTNNYKKILFRL